MAECNANPKLNDQNPSDQKVPMAKCSGHPRSHDPTRSVQKVPKAKDIVAGKLGDSRLHGQKVPKGSAPPTGGSENRAPPGGSESLFKTLSGNFARGMRLARCTTPWLPPLDGGMPFACGRHDGMPFSIPLACCMPA